MKKTRIFGGGTALLVLFIAGICAVQAQQITLSLADQNSELGWGPVHATQPWAKKVEEVTKGRVKIQIYPSETLVKGKEAWNATRDGICDISWNAGGQYTGLMPYSEVITLPGLPFRTAEQGSEVLWKLYERFPEVSREFADNHMLVLYTSEPFLLMTAKKQVKTLEDLKGLKIRTVGGPPVDQMKALGGVPVVLPMPECYVSMDKGVVDGMTAAWQAILGYKLFEVVKYYSEVPFSGNLFFIAMNKKKWNGLPKDVQDAIMSVGGFEGSKWWGRNFFDSAKEGVMKMAKEAGHEPAIYTLPENERNRWLEIGGRPIWEQWVKKMEEKRYSEARRVLNAVLEMLKYN